MRNGEHYPDPTAGRALRRVRVAGEADLERMDACRPHVPKLETISESEEQIAVMTWAKYMERKYPALKLLHHIPNGGSRNVAEAVNLKKMGVKPGVPDLCLPVPSGEYHALYIEMKAEKGRVSALQTEWIADLQKYGNRAVVCYGAKEAIDEIERYLK